MLSLPLRLLAVAALGAPVEGVIAFEAIFTFANFVEHGDIALPGRIEPRLAAVLVVPALHRRHHSSVRAELDSNFGTIFSFWDRWLGTFGESDPAKRFPIGLPDLKGPVPLAWALCLPFVHRA